jgi:hypothetical protein
MLKIFGWSLLFLLTVWCVPTAAQESTPAEEDTLTLEQALLIAQADNRQIKIAKQGEFSANELRIALRACRKNLVDVRLAGGGLLTPVSATFDQGVFGTVNGVPVPTENKSITTGIKATGMGIVQAYQPLSQRYNIHLNIQALEVGKKLAEEQTRQ